MVKLSVVVPFRDVEPFLGAALESIERQTLRDIEVIMVDDGSADGSTVVAKSFAAQDSRFRLIRQQNQGPGPARNAGVLAAAGSYLAFVDGDDVLAPHALGLLAGSLEESGSDLATGGVWRLNPGGSVVPSPLHEEPFRATSRRTHVTRRPALLKDRTVWNKVFRRRFWDSAGLTFPPGFYEDVPVALKAHVLASSVDVLRDVVYYWRARESGALSTTQRGAELSNLEDRMAAVADVGSFLAATAPRLKPAYDQSVLGSDLAVLVRAYELAGESQRARLADLAAGYLGTVDDAVYAAVPAAQRLRCYLLRNRMHAELAEVLRVSRRGEVLRGGRPNGDDEAPVTRRGGRGPRWYAEYPFFADPARGIPDRTYDVTEEMTLRARVDAVTWRGPRLRIEGHAYIRKLDSARPGDCDIRVSLRNARLRRTIRLKVERAARPDVTADSNQATACYDWSGFVTEVSPRRLATLPGLPLWRAASWELRVEVRGGGLRREGPTDAVLPGSARWPEGRWAGDKVWFQPSPEHDGRFVIRAWPVRACVTSCQARGDAIEIEGWTTASLSPEAAVTISPRQGDSAPKRVRAEPTAEAADGGRHAFRARVPIQPLARPLTGSTATDWAVHALDEITWDVSLADAGQPAIRLAIAPGTAGARARHGDREVTAIATPFGYLSLLERAVRPVVTGLDWTQEHRLILRGDHAGEAAGPARLILRHAESGRQHAVALAWNQGAFTAELTPGQMPTPAGELPLATGNWNLLAPTAGGEVTVAMARQLLPGLRGYRPVGSHEIELRPYRVDALRLQVRPVRPDGERGGYAQRQMERRQYPRALARPVRDLAVFDTFGGRQFACNPRAVYEQLRRVRPDLGFAWVSHDGQFRVPHGDQTVLAGSPAHFEALAQARYIVFNDALPGWFRKRSGQFCLQTWHGTPLKRIGFDIERPRFVTGHIYGEMLRQDVANWDVLLSPNEFSTPIFRRAFGFGGEIMESGYPRNDVLHGDGRQERAAAVRKLLGVPAGKRIVLYAPTWRDDSFRDGRYRFDDRLGLASAGQALGEDHVLLVRLHPKVQPSSPWPDSPRVRDVTSYPDITDLYLISDVLITDYSSAMFDFAATGRPMLFFTYDLESYRDRLRGFYFDFEGQAPGPLLSTSSDVIEAVRAADRVTASYTGAYDAFTAKFCALDDGRAAERAVNRLLTGPGHDGQD
jgi:CDP-glycerol glycerophosphotransferase